MYLNDKETLFFVTREINSIEITDLQGSNFLKLGTCQW